MNPDSPKSKPTKVSTENYKGTRDFYPEDMGIRRYLFETMRKVALSFGYEEYDGPMIESLDLYRAKTGEEIVGKQIYNFIDKGDREVAIRPEMTPTLARMVAKKSRELPRPIRWFSIPNLWRYEQPGHGRLREHWQLNVDIFGENSYRAEVEIIHLASEILFAFGANKDHFKIRISHRSLLNAFFQEILKCSEDEAYQVSKILDKKNKLKEDEYIALIQETLPQHKDAVAQIDSFLSMTLGDISKLESISLETKSSIQSLFQELESLGLGELLVFDPSIVRGFDYYTGFIFEIFDTSPKNKRSLYGGGRYDNLIGIFSNESLSGTGFGLGDVTLQNFLETHNLLPKPSRPQSLYLPLLEDCPFADAMQLSKELRSRGISVEMSLSPAKLGKQLGVAEKKGYRFVVILGQTELQSNKVILKDLVSHTQEEHSRGSFLEKIKSLVNQDSANI